MSSTTERKDSYSLFVDLRPDRVDYLAWLKDRFSPFRLLATSIITIIFVTSLSLLSYEYLVEGSYETLKHLMETAFVAVTLLIIIPPLLYVFSYRPLLSNMNKLQRTEKELRLLAAALESADDGIVITDNQGNIQWSNPAFAQKTGLTASEIYGQNVRLVEPGSGTIEEQEKRWEAVLSGQIWREVLNIRRDNERDLTEEQIITPVRDDNGTISHFILLEKDITEQRTLRQAADILATAGQTLNQSLNLNHVLAKMLDLLLTGVPYDNAAAVLVHHESQLVVRASRGREFEDRFRRNSMFSLADSEDCLHTQKLLTDRAVVLLPDTAVSPHWEPFFDGEDHHTGLGIPIVVEGKAIGFCVINKCQPDYFTAQHVEIAKALVSQAVAAIQNARLFEQVQAGRERLHSLSQRLVEIQETERRFIARELHDEAGQSLASLKIQLMFLEQQAHQPEAVVSSVAKLKQDIDDIAESLHRLAANLRPASLDHVGLLTALSQHVEAISSQHNLIGQFEAIGLEKRLPPDVETAVYRIVQEALTNVIRHAQATRADVILKQGADKLIIIVEDNGIGFDPVTAKSDNGVNDHLGLVGIRERVDMLGGQLIVESVLGNGTTLKIEVPHDDSRTDS